MMRLLIIIVLVAGGVFGLQSYVQPELAEAQRIRAEQTVVTDAISKAREVIRLRDELLARYNSISPADIDKIRKFLPAGSAASELFIDIDNVVADSDITLTGISFSEEGEGDRGGSVGEGVPAGDLEGRRTLTVTLNVEGTYEEFRSFLARIEKNLRLIDVVGITLQNEEKGTFGFEVILHAYYQERTIL